MKNYDLKKSVYGFSWGSFVVCEWVGCFSALIIEGAGKPLIKLSPKFLKKKKVFFDLLNVGDKLILFYACKKEKKFLSPLLFF